ncbi:MAG: bifunctional DNA-binding transcriptional regulator/O6-methylguanine-DNA methyltransferase Ada [Pseudomonadota bacterium]
MTSLTSLKGDDAWAAVCARDPAMDGVFVFAVRTTGVYCRPSCPARQPLRQNVTFYALAKDARAAGYRPCKRCRPDEISTHQRDALLVEAACRTLQGAETPPTLKALAHEANLSPHHFHRIFKAHTGVTPKAFGDAARARKTAAALEEGRTVADAAFGTGFQSLSRFYDAVAERFHVSPGALSSGGAGEIIVTAQASFSLGVVTAAFSRRGIASIVLTDTDSAGMEEIVARFREALFLDGGADFEGLISDVVSAIEEPALAQELPLDIRGTAFEERVWAALRKVPVGTTASYGDIAAAIGAPGAHRAVAKACGANRHAVAIPCHRIVRADGALSGYRWGVERKAALQRNESVDAH